MAQRLVDDPLERIGWVAHAPLALVRRMPEHPRFTDSSDEFCATPFARVAGMSLPRPASTWSAFMATAKQPRFRSSCAICSWPRTTGSKTRQASSITDGHAKERVSREPARDRPLRMPSCVRSQAGCCFMTGRAGDAPDARKAISSRRMTIRSQRRSIISAPVSKLRVAQVGHELGPEPGGTTLDENDERSRVTRAKWGKLPPSSGQAR